MTLADGFSNQWMAWYDVEHQPGPNTNRDWDTTTKRCVDKAVRELSKVVRSYLQLGYTDSDLDHEPRILMDRFPPQTIIYWELKGTRQGKQKQLAVSSRKPEDRTSFHGSTRQWLEDSYTGTQNQSKPQSRMQGHGNTTRAHTQSQPQIRTRDFPQTHTPGQTDRPPVIGAHSRPQVQAKVRPQTPTQRQKIPPQTQTRGHPKAQPDDGTFCLTTESEKPRGLSQTHSRPQQSEERVMVDSLITALCQSLKWWYENERDKGFTTDEDWVSTTTRSMDKASHQLSDILPGVIQHQYTDLTLDCQPHILLDRYPPQMLIDWTLLGTRQGRQKQLATSSRTSKDRTDFQGVSRQWLKDYRSQSKTQSQTPVGSHFWFSTPNQS